LRTSFLARLVDNLADDYGIVAVELDNGYGLLWATSLDGARSITAKKVMTDKQKIQLREDIDQLLLDFRRVIRRADRDNGVDE
jgi:hypothetical protein